MIIAKGESWGEPAPGVEAHYFDSERELAAAAFAAWKRGEHLIGAVGEGDLLIQLGVPARRDSDVRYRYPFDLAVAELDHGVEVPFIVHLQARRRLWSGSFAVAMNVGWLGEWYLGPRAHPNDGLLDITVGRLGWRARLAARQRVGTGSHLPHPALKTLRRATWDHGFDRPVRVIADGIHTGTTRSLRVRCLPDCLTVIV